MDRHLSKPIILRAFCCLTTAQDLLKNFLSIQKEDGSIDGKPGLAVNGGRYLAARFGKFCMENP